MMDERIIKFIKRHHVMTLATVVENKPWCCNLFYTLNGNSLVFTSDTDTQHITQALQNPCVAVSILLESKVVGRLQGAQITGRLEEGTAEHTTAFIKKYPFAAVNLAKVWAVCIKTVKYTDNTLGFGKKLHYTND